MLLYIINILIRQGVIPSNPYLLYRLCTEGWYFRILITDCEVDDHALRKF